MTANVRAWREWQSLSGRIASVGARQCPRRHWPIDVDQQEGVGRRAATGRHAAACRHAVAGPPPAVAGPGAAAAVRCGGIARIARIDYSPGGRYFPRHLNGLVPGPCTTWTVRARPDSAVGHRCGVLPPRCGFAVRLCPVKPRMEPLPFPGRGKLRPDL